VELEVLEIAVSEVIEVEDRTIKLYKDKAIKLKLSDNILLISKPELVTTVTTPGHVSRNLSYWKERSSTSRKNH
jgi:hypothetical protein